MPSFNPVDFKFLIVSLRLLSTYTIYNNIYKAIYMMGFPGGSDGKESACNVGELGWEDPIEEGMAIHSSIFAWRIPMDKGGWRVTVHGVTKNQTRLSD